MDGKQLVNILNVELKRQGISKGDFYDAIGISATAFYGWKNGAEPKRDKIEAIEKYLGIDLSDYEKCDPREEMRDVDSILLNSVADLPPSSVYALIAQVEKMKEDAT